MTLDVFDRPNWVPLLTRLTPHQCATFMYVGRIGTIHLYKHKITRRYLNLDAEGSCFVWRWAG